jgi:hypothetical protein
VVNLVPRFNQKNSSKLCIGLKTILLCLLFPQFFEPDYRLPAGSQGRQAAGMTSLIF